MSSYISKYVKVSWGQDLLLWKSFLGSVLTECQVFGGHCTDGFCGAHPPWHSWSGGEHKQFGGNLGAGPCRRKLKYNDEPYLSQGCPWKDPPLSLSFSLFLSLLFWHNFRHRKECKNSYKNTPEFSIVRIIPKNSWLLWRVCVCVSFFLDHLTVSCRHDVPLLLNTKIGTSKNDISYIITIKLSKPGC